MPIQDLEDAIADAALDGWASQVEDVRRSLLALWSARGGRLTAHDIDAALRLLRLPRRLDARTLLLPAARFGNEAIGGDTDVVLDLTAVAALDGVEGKAGLALAEAVRRARALELDMLAEVVATLAPLASSVAQMRSTASWAVNYAANSATAHAARQRGVGYIWVPERDACVICTSYAGQTDASGFGGGAGFDGSQLPTVPFPPAHPNCRCELHEWAGDRGTVEALQREAVRSILRGWSLPGESAAARLRAARNVLTRGLSAPESVRDVARRALERGKFR